MRRKAEIETIFIPHEYMVFADRRTDAIVRRCCYDQNIIESIQRSCYLQGVMDGVQVAIERPEVRQIMSEYPGDQRFANEETRRRIEAGPFVDEADKQQFLLHLEAWMAQDRMLQFFQYAHLPPELQEVSKDFCDLAHKIVEKYPQNPERTVTLRKLLEAKDACVRTLLYKEY